MKKHSIEMLQIIANGLGDLLQDVVFVGGAIVGLYATDKAAPEARSTIDVDCIIELASKTELNKLEELLRSKGFRNDMSKGAPICRWIYEDVVVDIMPTDSSVLGFTNDWFDEGLKNSVEYELPNRTVIRILSSPYLIASKINAFEKRGEFDMRISPDFEDIIYVIDNRKELKEEILRSEINVKKYIQTSFKSFSNKDMLEEGVNAVLPYGSGKERFEKVMELIREIAEN
jgi:hypothetical protein